MTRGRFKTSIMWHDSRGSEIEADVIVIYERTKGYAGDRIDPPEADSVEIISVKHAVADPEAPTIPASFDEDEGLIAECLEDWALDEIEAQEWRAQSRYDQSMEGF